jgi:hypothetical protein
MKRWMILAALAAFCVSPAAAQQSGLGELCGAPEIPAAAREHCLVVAQAAESAQPQLGILVAGGNPTLGTAGAGGLRLGVLPRVSATGKVNFVMVRLPDVLTEGSGRVSQQLNRTVGIPAPALSATGTVGVYPGVSVLPGVGGIGAIDLMGTATWLPLRLVGVEGVGEGTSSTAFGGGVRLGLLRESFLVPGVSASLMYRRLGTIEYGDVCPAPAQSQTQQRGGATIEYGSCPAGGDPGEFSFDLSNWSTRFAASKRLFGLGVAGGVGYDRFSSDLGFGFRAPPGSGQQDYFARIQDADLGTGRWSAFVNGSFSLLVATLAVEAGWMQGGDAISGFQGTGNPFNPGRGTFFGSVGGRLAL